MRSFMTGCLMTLLVSGSALAGDAPVLDNDLAKTSYSLGVNIGRSIQKQPVDLNPDLLAKGMVDVLNGKGLLMDNATIDATLATLEKNMQQRQAEKARQEATTNLDAGRSFLAENAKKPGVVTLPSGLQYEVLAKGEGPKPTEADTVTVHYRGSLIDGREFDSSLRRGQPAQFPLKGIIPGWQEALQLMSKGAKWKLFIPPSLAYGERQAGPMIGPNSVLVFEVELLDIKK